MRIMAMRVKLVVKYTVISERHRGFEINVKTQ